MRENLLPVQMHTGTVPVSVVHACQNGCLISGAILTEQYFYC